MKITDVFPALLEEHVKGLSLRPSATKSGPGRVHTPGHKRGKPPSLRSGASLGFAQHTNDRKNLRRRAKAEMGARQYRKQVKALRLASREV